MTVSIPVSLIGGYLGAGKTTLVNSLLRHAGGRRLAVLVNEFGALPIDADLIAARDDNLISISGGCICCSFGSDLVAALIDIRTRGQPIDHLLIETSGVALPGSIVQSIALLPGLAIDGVIVLADAETVEERADDRYMGDTVRGQLAGADIVVLNKVDLVSPERVAAISRRLAEIAPGARIVPAAKADIPAEIILGGQPEPRSMAPRLQPSRHRTSGYETLNLELDSARKVFCVDPMARSSPFMPSDGALRLSLHPHGSKVRDGSSASALRPRWIARRSWRRSRP